MPRIPQIVQNQELRPGHFSVQDAAKPGEAAAQLGGAVTDIGQQMLSEQIQLKRSRDLMESNSVAEDAATKVYNSTLQDNTIPPEQLADAVKAELKKVHDLVAKDIKDPIVRLHFDQNFEGVMDRSVTTATTVGFKRSVDDYNAQANASIDQYVIASGPASPEDADHYGALIKGIIDGQVAHGALTKVQAQAELEKRSSQISEARWREDIRLNPYQAIVNLEKDASLDPLKKQELLDKANTEAHQQSSALHQAQEEAAKQRKQGMDSEASQFLLDAELQNGKASFDRLNTFVSKYATGGEPVSRETVEALSNALDRKPRELPSNQDVYLPMRVQAYSTNPPSQKTLNDLYNGGHGPINQKDWSELSIAADNSRQQMANQDRVLANEQRTQNEKVITDEFGGDREIHASALKDLLSGSTLKDIEQKYAPVYKLSSDFKKAQTSYETALQQYSTWQNSYFGVHATDNPHKDQFERKTQEFIIAAGKAGRDFGKAPLGAPEGKIFTDAKGHSVMIVGGHVIGQ